MVSPGRLYDENIALVRETVAGINSRYPELGGMILFLDNEKAFDRVQHDFMFATRLGLSTSPSLWSER